MVRDHANFNTTNPNATFPSEYDGTTGAVQSGQASPQQGGLRFLRRGESNPHLEVYLN